MTRLLVLPLIVFALASCTKLHVYDPNGLPSSVTVSRWSDAITLEPNVVTSTTAILFYPGGLVEADSYVPLMAKVAAKGYRVLIAKVPFELAVFDPLVGQKFFGKWPDAKWVGSGHSLGGAMVCQLAKKDSRIKALLLLAAYPAESDTLAATSLPVLSISGEKDGLATPAKIADNKKYLPATTTYLVIAGGNHAQFGSYGAQNGDNTASITEAQQQDLVAGHMDLFLKSLP